MIVPFEVRKAFLAESTHVTRRVEIYEQDGQTPFEQALWNTILVDGTVSLDNSDEERRTLELTLANPQSRLDPTIGKLWYDKIIKVFYGVHVPPASGLPTVAVVEDNTDGTQAANLGRVLAGTCSVTYLPITSRVAEVEEYDILVFISTNGLTKKSLLNEANAMGVPTFVFTSRPNKGDVPLLVGTVSEDASHATSSVTPVDPDTASWESFTITDYQTRGISAARASAEVVADALSGPLAITYSSSQHGARSAFVRMSDFSRDSLVDDVDYANCKAMLASIISWLRADLDTPEWEAQLGEFLIDSVSATSETLGQIELTGRDRVKQCKNSKLEQAVTFEKGRSIESIIDTLAANAWVPRRNLPITGDSLDRDMTYEPDTTRWEIMRELATSFNYDLYFDNTGVLVMSKFQDPLSTPASLDLSVGRFGNLVSRGLRTSDTELFNHIVVVGEGSDSEAPPVWASAINENPQSPSNVYELGDRVNRYTSSTITTRKQAQELADSMLSVASLEEFELDFSTPLLPWVEPGQIVFLTDEAAGTWGPNRFLISSLSFPLDLSPMTGSGKRVINVG